MAGKRGGGLAFPGDREAPLLPPLTGLEISCARSPFSPSSPSPPPAASSDSAPAGASITGTVGDRPLHLGLPARPGGLGQRLHDRAGPRRSARRVDRSHERGRRGGHLLARSTRPACPTAGTSAHHRQGARADDDVPEHHRPRRSRRVPTSTPTSTTWGSPITPDASGNISIFTGGVEALGAAPACSTTAGYGISSGTLTITTVSGSTITGSVSVNLVNGDWRGRRQPVGHLHDGDQLHAQPGAVGLRPADRASFPDPGPVASPSAASRSCR